MGRKRHTPEQIITALREAEVGLARGKSVKLISRELGITEQTYYRWRREYGGMKVRPDATSHGTLQGHPPDRLPGHLRGARGDRGSSVMTGVPTPSGAPAPVAPLPSRRAPPKCALFNGH